MKKMLLFIVSVILTLSSFSQKASTDSLFTPDYVLNIMKRTADWQLDDWKTQGFKRAKYDWTNAAAFTGIMELAKIDTDKKYTDFLVNIGNELNWNTGPRRFHADDY